MLSVPTLHTMPSTCASNVCICFVESALVLIVKYVNNEGSLQPLLSAPAELASGVQLRTNQESRHILQLIVSGEVDSTKTYNPSSRINADNQQLLVALLQRVCVVGTTHFVPVHVTLLLKVHVEKLQHS